MAIKEKIEQMIDELSETQLQQVADYIAFLQFRARFLNPDKRDEDEVARLYAEFAETDRLEAEAGMDEYTALLFEEDAK